MSKTLFDLGFTGVRTGLWINYTYNASVVLDEDYGRTFRAYRGDRVSDNAVRNAAGRQKRFRTAVAAARALIKGE